MFGSSECARAGVVNPAVEHAERSTATAATRSTAAMSLTSATQVTMPLFIDQPAIAKRRQRRFVARRRGDGCSTAHCALDDSKADAANCAGDDDGLATETLRFGPTISVPAAMLRSQRAKPPRRRILRLRLRIEVARP